MMTYASRIDYLNIALMMLSFVVALVLPFELFLFSYAVLGPLHYITEISWLEERQFFLKKKSDVVFLIVACALMFLQAVFAADLEILFKRLLPGLQSSHTIHFLILGALICLGSLTIFSFFAAWIFNSKRTRLDRYLWLCGCLYLIVVMRLILPAQYDFFALMLPTIIHVSVFTALFILAGALKQNLISGYLVFGLYILLAGAFFVFDLVPLMWVSDYARHHYMASDFQRINTALLGFRSPATESNLFSQRGFFTIQAFIAFVYTYHYLNWFSKTGLVGWHKVGRAKLILFAGLWLASLGLYMYDYRVGLTVLLFFSLLHVILEFPLNHKVGAQIVTELRHRLRVRFE